MPRFGEGLMKPTVTAAADVVLQFISHESVTAEVAAASILKLEAELGSCDPRVFL